MKEERRNIKSLDSLHPIAEFVIGGTITLLSAFFTMWLCQFSCECSLTEIITISAFILYFCIYAIIFAVATVISGQLWLGNCISTVFLFAVTVLNYQVYSFRGTEILPGDIGSIRTALGIAGNYRPNISGRLVVSLLLLVVYILLLRMFVKCRKGVFWRSISSGILVLAVVVLMLFIDNVPLIVFENDGMKCNTFPVNFCRLVQGSAVEQPEGYSAEVLKELDNTYRAEADTQKRPTVIAIMNESFADLSVVGNLPVDEDVIPFFHSMKDNTVKGYAQVPVFGAGTANTEWEFLTGHTMHFLPPGATPYSNFGLTNSFTSIVTNLKKLGYNCVAMHPYHEYMYTRNAVYPRMGFDEMLFLQDFPQEKMLRDYVSDREMYEQIIKKYETRPDDTPLFIFGVTMQNHGGYAYQGENYTKTVALDNMSREYPKAEQYLSIVKESDSALEYLIQYFTDVEDDVVIAFFGDHQPSVEQEFYNEIASGKSKDQIDLDMHKVPFFVWSNYDTEEQTVEYTSVNYLTNYLYDVAQLPKPSYNVFLSQMQKYIPVFSAYGVYIQSEKKYVAYDELSGIEAKYMKQYNYLVYNAVYDIETRSSMFKSDE